MESIKFDEAISRGGTSNEKRRLGWAAEALQDGNMKELSALRASLATYGTRLGVDRASFPPSNKEQGNIDFCRNQTVQGSPTYKRHTSPEILISGHTCHSWMRNVTSRSRWSVVRDKIGRAISRSCRILAMT
jgi:hypothetical protein